MSANRIHAASYTLVGADGKGNAFFTPVAGNEHELVSFYWRCQSAEEFAQHQGMATRKSSDQDVRVLICVCLNVRFGGKDGKLQLT